MPRERIVVYTAVADHYNEVRAPELRSQECDYVCFTDDRHARVDGWEVRPFDEMFDDPARTAKKPKILPHRFFPDHEVSIWIDGNLTIRGDLRDLAERSLEGHSMALFRHPDGRSCLFEEAEACLRLGKDHPGILRGQIDRYRALGFRDQRGLQACGVLIRRHRARGISRAMEAWWSEITRHSKRDQISFPFVAWRHALDYAVIDGDIRDNPYLAWRPHDHKERRRRLEQRIASSDAVVVSFPKSGRTWIRFFLAKYLEGACGRELSLDFPRGDGSPGIAFTHDFFDLNQNRAGAPEILLRRLLEGKRLVVLVRDPRDVLVSYYHQKRDREGLPVGSLRRFASSPVFGIERQAGFVLELLELLDRHPGEHLLIAYEDLHRNPRGELRRLARFVLGRDPEEAPFRAALDASCFPEMQRFEQEISHSGSTESVFHRLGDPRWDGNPEALKVRRGRVGGYRREMGPLLRRRVGRGPRTRRLLEELRRRCRPS